jgi:hypothetical protein
MSSSQGAVAIATSGYAVNAIACAPSGLTSSALATSSAYTLRLSAPYVLAVADGAPPPGSAQYTLHGSTTIVIGQSATYASPPAQHASFACYVQDPSPGQVAACNGDGVTCASGSVKASLGVDGGYWDTGAAGFGDFWPGDTLSVVLCPGAGDASAGYLASVPVSIQFGGSVPATSPTLSGTTPTASTYMSPLVPVLVNGNAAAVTACYTTDGTTPGCSAGVCTGATTSSLALGGASSQSANAPIGAALENNGTHLAVVACNASLTASSPNDYVYASSFVLATPTPSVAPGDISADTSITLSTTSTFADTTIVYSFDGSPPDCSGVGATIIQGSSGVIPPSALPPPYFTGHLIAIACAGTAATNQTTSGVLEAVYTVVPY